MAPSLNLSDDQRFALMKFRRNVSDCTKRHNDLYLLRWLRARNYDTEAAEKMLRDSLEWRKQWEADDIKSWNPPEVVSLYYPSGMCGVDMQGAPVLVVPFAGMDMWGMLHSAGKSDVLKQTIQVVEGFMEFAQKQGTLYGTEASQVIVIIDMENFNLRQYAWRPAGEVALTLLQMYDANYPEILKACFIINAPQVFALAFSVVKTFLHEDTLRKIKIFKSDASKWKKALLERISPEELPAYYGGSMTDPDGNPRCPSKIKQGGKIPKSYYIKKSEKTNGTTFSANYTTALVRKGSKMKLPFITADEGSYLKWEFRSERHDIKFGVICTNLDGKDTVVVPIHRVNCHEDEEVGVIPCPEPATYTVVFDNSYSYLRNKKIHYSIQITPPLGTMMEGCTL